MFGKAMRSGSVMSLLRITLLVAFQDAWAFQMTGTPFLQCLASHRAVSQEVLLLLGAPAYLFVFSPPQAPFLQPLLPLSQFPLSHARGGRYEDADAGVLMILGC